MLPKAQDTESWERNGKERQTAVKVPTSDFLREKPTVCVPWLSMDVNTPHGYYENILVRLLVTVAQFANGPIRPRLRPIGPANQGIRERRPGRLPLIRKAEPTASSSATVLSHTMSLTLLTASQKVFGFYSSLDIDIL